MRAVAAIIRRGTRRWRRIARTLHINRAYCPRAETRIERKYQRHVLAYRLALAVGSKKTPREIRPGGTRQVFGGAKKPPQIFAGKSNRIGVRGPTTWVQQTSVFGRWLPVILNDWSGWAKARSGLRMMPTFPLPSLKFRTAGFPSTASRPVRVESIPSSLSLGKQSPSVSPRSHGAVIPLEIQPGTSILKLNLSRRAL